MAGTMRMRLIGATMLAALATMPSSLLAAAGQGAGSEVVVTGVRSKLSNWRRAETSHVVVLSDGSEAELVRLTRNLERLHFLLSGLMGRGTVDDDLVKIHVTLIGQAVQFEQMNLNNLRWQQGPYNELFKVSRYYDPREDGAVMASINADQRVAIERTGITAEAVQSIITSSLRQMNNPATSPGGGAMAAMNAAADADAAIGALSSIPSENGGSAATLGAQTMQVTAENLLYAGYAQHFLLTYFPAAYPRWYLDGFGQVFSTLAITRDNDIEFGRAPDGALPVIERYGAFPIKQVLDDSYLSKKPADTDWTPIHAWMLTHFLLFSDKRRPQLTQYLATRARGASPETAAAIFGNQAELGRELQAYFRARKPYLKVSYDGARIEQPIVRRLRESEVAFIKGRLELGARVEIPPAPGPGADAATARSMTKARDTALAERARWLDRLRGDAARWRNEPEAQLLLAEAECRSGNAAECLAAAKRAEVLAPGDPRMLVWKGTATIMQASNAPAPERARLAAEGRGMILKANQADHDAVGPLLAFYRSFVATGETPSANAVEALQKVVEEVPAAPTPRLQLADALVRNGDGEDARDIILPVAVGPYNSPERPSAKALLDRIAQSTSGSAAPAPADRQSSLKP
jgi:hypothetical protein